MARLKISDEWWTAPAEDESGNTLLVTGRSGLENVRETGHYNYCLQVKWPYRGNHQGMPDVATSKLMGQVHDALLATFDADPVAVVAAVVTGGDLRYWIIYARSLHIFQRKFNEVLAPFEQLPLSFDVSEDPDWEEYNSIAELAIEPGDE